MKLNQLPNLRVEDFQSEQSWIGNLFIQLNPFFQSVNQLFDDNIEFGTNIKAVTRECNIASAFQEFSFQWPYVGTDPIDLKVTRAYKGAQLTPAILALSWSYDSTASVITVKSMVELSTAGVAALSGRYQFTVRATV